VCEKVDVFGFDVAKPKVPIRYHYFDKAEPTELHSTEFEHNLLRVMNAYGLIRLCTVDSVEVLKLREFAQCVREITPFASEFEFEWMKLTPCACEFASSIPLGRVI
jgi:hypothetical protein